MPDEETGKPTDPPLRNGGDPTKAGDDNVGVDGSTLELSYKGIFVSAVILLVALTSKNNYDKHKYYEYGISVAAISMILSFVACLVLIAKVEGTTQVLMTNNYVLFAWNFVGAGILTFNGPFEDTGNGYFAAWGLVVFSTMAIGVNASTIAQKTDSNNGPSLALMAAAIVLTAAIASIGVQNDDKYFGELVYTLVVTCLTIVLVGGLLSHGEESNPAKSLYIMILLSILWIVAGSLCTFRGPFLVTGNGYFASWGGALASLFALNAARKTQPNNTS